MKDLNEIQNQLFLGQFEYSRHAFKRVIERDISDLEIKEAGKNAQIIENYPNDKYSPSCLLLGFTSNGKPLHIQVSRAETNFVKIITLYIPDKRDWIDYSNRR